MHAYIIQQLIRIILFITISLPIGLKSFAQETKRFYMELDTPRNGAKAGQELELKYISTADFDSVSPPDFGTLIETVEGVTPQSRSYSKKRHIDRYLRAGIQLPHTFQEARKHQTTSGIHQGKRKGIRNTSDQCMGTSGRYQYRQCKMQHSAGGFLSQRSFHCHRDLSLNRLVIDPLIVSETKKIKRQDK